MEKIVEVKKLRKSYDRYDAVKEISFDVAKGSIFAFLGPNGAGKSTTMNILSTLLLKSSGDVSICGYTLGKENLHIQKNIGIVFQHNTLDEELTIYDNLYLRGLLYGCRKAELQARIDWLAQTLQLTPYLHKRLQHCSGGQQRLAMLARALIGAPKLLILDEPTTGLDPHVRRKLWECLQTLKQDKKLTIFFSSHYMEEALQADYVCMMHQGKILRSDTPKRLLEQYGQKILTIEGADQVISKEVYSLQEAMLVLQKNKNMHAFSLQNPTLEDVFLKLTASLRGGI